ncbi:MAG: hypothetical protein J0L69_13530 [Bacteroidetes bacterium]|nr:hypothetical protein [Bacteroidota bacterium]
MKKSIALLALAFGVTGAYAQDLTSKKGEPILPEAEDWSIGVDATPFLNYVGNMFGKTANNVAPTWNNYGANQTIVGKKFKDAQNAYRAIVRIGYSNQSWKNEIAKPVASTSTPPTFPNKPEMVEDKYSRSSTFVGVGVGMEKRKGKTRLQGFYGADVFIWFSSSKDKFKYGNDLVQQNAASTIDPDVDPVTHSTDWSTIPAAGLATANTGNTGLNAGAVQWRKLSEKSGGQFGLGVRAFIGAEYFILPKISLAGEFGWGVGVAMNLKSKTVYEAEGLNSAGDEVKGEIENTAKRGMQLILDTDRNAAAGSQYNLTPNGTLRLNFHF